MRAKSFLAVSTGFIMAGLWLACGATDGDGTGGTNGAGLNGNNGNGGASVDGGQSDGTITIDGTTSGDGISGCDPQDFTLQQAPAAEVYMVIDRSGSMLEDGASPPNTKWDEVNAAVDATLTQYEDTIRFGLLMYPDGDECATSGPQVGVDVGNRLAILYHLGTTPQGGTPTAAALNNAASSLTDLGSPDSPKFVILATDGGPNCNYFLSADPQCSCTEAAAEYCCTSYPDPCFFGYSCLDDAKALEVITHLHDDLNIDTFVIGLAGTSEYEGLLNAMAIAGGVPQQGGSTDYYAANDQAQLLAALQAIAVTLISCEIEFSEAPEYPDEVWIYIDGVLVPRDVTKQNGWDYLDTTYTKIMLYGQACDKLQDGQEHVVTATFGCDIN